MRPIDLGEAERRLAEIEAALERLENGSYGRCASCGEEIADDEIEADPARLTCARCGAVAGGEG
jgi:DnaK suppressor protein